MNLDEAQQAFAAGKLREVVVEPADEGNGWMIMVRDSAGALLTVTDHSGIEKIYHTLDNATDAAKTIGFKMIRVEESF
ncbi:MAG: thymidylate kinase [Pseudomonadota bacterium]|nr:MAG: thymidylate kinase [Pseudomonadota bacterium]